MTISSACRFPHRYPFDSLQRARAGQKGAAQTGRASSRKRRWSSGGALPYGEAGPIPLSISVREPMLDVYISKHGAVTGLPFSREFVCASCNYTFCLPYLKSWWRPWWWMSMLWHIQHILHYENIFRRNWIQDISNIRLSTWNQIINYCRIVHV